MNWRTTARTATNVAVAMPREVHDRAWAAFPVVGFEHCQGGRRENIRALSSLCVASWSAYPFGDCLFNSGEVHSEWRFAADGVRSMVSRPADGVGVIRDGSGIFLPEHVLGILECVGGSRSRVCRG